MRGRTQRAQRLRRSRRRNTRLFKNALNQCLCGLQGINGWDGAWGLVVAGFAVWLCLGWNECGGERKGRREIAEGAEGIRGRTQKTQKLRKSRKREYQICLKKARTSVYAGCRA